MKIVNYEQSWGLLSGAFRETRVSYLELFRQAVLGDTGQAIFFRNVDEHLKSQQQIWLLLRFEVLVYIPKKK